jgi:phosphatidylserine/phosphatidylglycerophosphate/cardiolipin synthase-like enzyme
MDHDSVSGSAAGIIFYFLFSQNIAAKDLPDDKIRGGIINASLNEQSMRSGGEFAFTNPSRRSGGYDRLHQTYSDSFFTQDNKVSVLTDGGHKFDSLIKDLKNAKQTIISCILSLKTTAWGGS